METTKTLVCSNCNESFVNFASESLSYNNDSNICYSCQDEQKRNDIYNEVIANEGKQLYEIQHRVLYVFVQWLNIHSEGSTWYGYKEMQSVIKQKYSKKYSLDELRHATKRLVDKRIVLKTHLTRGERNNSTPIIAGCGYVLNY